tara:strand:- start:13771 stop:14739 length:969 start_codon:yes stop_codon:yes gene_type:complete
MPSFFMGKLLAMLGFRREKSINISDETLKESLKLLKTISWDNAFISPVWEAVFSKFGISKLNETQGEVDYELLKSSYEDFFVNGLSDGACVGADLKRVKSAMKYAVRGSRRLILLKNHFDFTGSYSDPLSSLALSPELSSGRPWLQKLSGAWVNPELIDHAYFFELCRYLPIPKERLLFIGDGSGILSNIFLNNTNVKEATFIDLPHFLLRQHIVNNGLTSVSKKYLTPDQVDGLTNINQRRVLINQDSFPEIPEQYLEIYFDLITSGYITDVLSYNKKDSSFGHADFRSILLSKGIKCLLSVESVMRPGYFIEWYSSHHAE